MDFSESTKVVYGRIQTLEPDNVSKIIGYLLLQDHGERDMIRLAFSPDNVINSLINKAKAKLGLSKPVSVPISISQVDQAAVSELPLQFTLFSPASSCSITSPATVQPGGTYWESQLPVDRKLVHNVDFVSPAYSDSYAEDCHLQNQMHFLSLEDQLDSFSSVGSDFSSNYHYPEPALGVRTSQRSPSLTEFPVKICHYFSKGFCKHGNNCRYFHSHPMPESLSQILNSSSNEFRNEEQVFSPGLLEKLEMEITELLNSRRGYPVSIASLPMLYYEKYGRTLQAEGYLTESQRYGKVGYSLTKLLSKLKNICLIDRPNGQHSVVLAEDVPKYMEYASERSEPGGIVVGSRQIYLTFPADSTFTEQDVSNYFNMFGPVQDVRIPCQQKRMFGFVTFVYPETVRQILAKGNPHFVCGARVLVKPYREKSRLVERKYAEKIQHSLYNSPQFIDGDSELHSVPRVCDNSRLLREQVFEEHEQAHELERRCFSKFQLTHKLISSNPYFDFSLDELKLAEEQVEFPSAERFNYLLNVLNNGSTSDDKIRHIKTYYNEQDSGQGLNLPESPFASAIGNGISTVI
ncbi:zinc finger CCCH domain-containing protein 18 [Quillaja saponaria]|uniref:Zinc finger CCCH domain-containing protein 18 n=1 Tax=Quillaja saponaria TaxID=32244 RepID=A0AAD7LLD3_QUISA|nr:zinc finger CCCH domain-containing protein 18 [Quillaja saponaria]